MTEDKQEEEEVILLVCNDNDVYNTEEEDETSAFFYRIMHIIIIFCILSVFISLCIWIGTTIGLRVKCLFTISGSSIIKFIILETLLLDIYGVIYIVYEPSFKYGGLIILYTLIVVTMIVIIILSNILAHNTVLNGYITTVCDNNLYGSFILMYVIGSMIINILIAYYTILY